MADAVLASWNEGAAKQSILDFVERVTSGGPDFVAPADRIAAFDNDGTLWVEQPLPPQFDFVFRKWAEEVKANPAQASEQPYKALIEKDPSFLQGVATQTRTRSRCYWTRSRDRGAARPQRSSRRRSGPGWQQ